MEYKNILIIKMSSLGDVLHTLPFAAVLRQRFPEARLTWLVHPQFAGFVPDPPLIDEVLYFDKVRFKALSWRGKIKYFRQMRALLQSRHFDLVLDMQGLFKSAVLAGLTGCPTRLGYCEMREGSCLVSRAIVGAHARDHVIERYLDVARYLGAKVEAIEFPLPDLTKEWGQVRVKLGLPEEQAYVVLVPGARWETKRWPAASFAALAGLLLKDGAAVVLAGGKEDLPLGLEIAKRVREAEARSLAEADQVREDDAAENLRAADAPGTALSEAPVKKVASASPRLVNLIGQTSLRELGALIQRARFYISADTGPLFIATACKIPLIALYGPTRPDRTGPYGSPEATVLLTPAACAGCLKKKCEDWHCMTDITPEAVFKLYRQKLANLGGTKVGTES